MRPRYIVARTMSDISLMKKIQAAIELHPWLETRSLQRRLHAIWRDNASNKSKRGRVIKIATELNDALAPVSACRKGCSHCCHENLPLLEHEAERLARVSGKPMRRLPSASFNDMRDGMTATHGTPCPFLVDDACSVYEDRPFYCRLLLSLNDTAAECAKLEGPDDINSYELKTVLVVYNLINAKIDPNEPWSSIHGYFGDVEY